MSSVPFPGSFFCERMKPDMRVVSVVALFVLVRGAAPPAAL